MRFFIITLSMIALVSCTSSDESTTLGDKTKDDQIFSEIALKNPERFLVFQADKPIQPVMRRGEKIKLPKIHIINKSSSQIYVRLWFNARPLGDDRVTVKEIHGFRVSIRGGKRTAIEGNWPVGEKGKIDGVYVGFGDIAAGPQKFLSKEAIIWTRRGDAPVRLKIFADAKAKSEISHRFRLRFNKTTQIATIVDQTETR